MKININTLKNKYEIKLGDSLDKIAHEVLNDYSNWREVLDMNPNLGCFSELPIGEMIRIPTQEEINQLNVKRAMEIINRQDISNSDDLDLSSLKGANVWGALAHQLIEWVL